MTSALIVMLLFGPPFNAFERCSYLLDQRSEQSILFIGNARVSSNDMPMMIRRIADSAGYSRKLHIEVYGSGDDSMTSHATDPRVTELLQQDWDYVVFQAQSNEEIDRQNWGKWLLPTRSLIDEARKAGAVPAMFVAWRYTEQCPQDLSWNATNSRAMHVAIQQKHDWLVRTSQVASINVGFVWEAAQDLSHDFSLYADCSRPSVHGSYLAALTVFDRLLDGDVAAVTYSPDAVLSDQALLIRDEVKAALLSTSSAMMIESGDNDTAEPQDPSADRSEALEKVPAVCIWSIFDELQAVREVCGFEPSPVDRAMDEALRVIGPHLQSVGELEPRYQSQPLEQGLEVTAVCQSAAQFRSAMTVEKIDALTRSILAAGPGDFSKACI